MTVSLILAGETRFDAYVSLSILVYFVSTSVLPNIRGKTDLRLIDIIFIVTFMVIVAVRVADILGYTIPGMPK